MTAEAKGQVLNLNWEQATRLAKDRPTESLVDALCFRTGDEFLKNTAFYFL